MSRVNRAGNPALVSSSTASRPAATTAGATVTRPPASSYAGATKASAAATGTTGGSGDWSTRTATSPGFTATAATTGAGSPWIASSSTSTTLGSATTNRYKTRTGAAAGGSTAGRALFTGEPGKAGTTAWEDGGDGGEEGGVPEHWESYDAGQSSNASLAPSVAGTEPHSLDRTPFDSPTLGGLRDTEINGEKLMLDERGTDISLSLINRHKTDGPHEVSIHMLSLLYDPPVQGCEMRPYVSILDSYGRMAAVQTDEAAAQLDFRWFRGQKRICSNTTGSCTKAATIQCVSCSKMSANVIPQHLTYFCSEKCLRENWPQHKQLHMQSAMQKPHEVKEWSYDEEEDERPDSPSQSHLYCKYPALLQNAWQETGCERAYVPQADDVGRALRLECSPILKQPAKKDAATLEKDKLDPPITTTSQNNADLNLGTVVRIDTGAVIPTPPPPPPRVALYTDPSTPINSSNTFKTVCYNVLAQIYATRQVYPYTTIWALSWEYRRNLLLREIISHNADVICLQEVQSNHFEQFFQPQLSKHGYDSIFKKKTRDAGSDLAGKEQIDGCATFYKRERFALMEQYGIEFNEAARQHTANRTQLKRLIRGNIALVLVLEELTPPPASSNSAAARRNRKRRLCIANTHIFWDPEFADVKLWQTWVLCQELEKLVLPRNLPLVLCGDFNSLVESSVYELLSTERVEQGEDVFGPTGDPSGLLPAPHLLSHRLPLLSAYATINEPKYTNYTGSFVGVLDYIFFTRTHLRCVACMDVDDESQLRQHTALPSPMYPSDHISLVSTLEFLDA